MIRTKGKTLTRRRVVWQVTLGMTLFLWAAVPAQVVIVDDQDSGCSRQGAWTQDSASPQRHALYAFVATTATTATASVVWRPALPATGNYEVSVWYVDGTDRPAAASYTVTDAGGPQTVPVDQRTAGGQWVTLGTFPFEAGTTGSVSLTSESAEPGATVCADAVRWVREGTAFENYQGMWIVSWDFGAPNFRSPAETQQMIAHARQNNINALFPQVSKAGDAYYISALRPFASNIVPGYTDPLADILSQAHDTSAGKQRIEVHAWLNTYYSFFQPDLLTYRYSGTRLGSYLDPGHPQVVDHLTSVVVELVRNYAIDGVHFDFFRYDGVDCGYHPVAVGRFQRLYGRLDKPPTNDAEWGEFRREQVKALGRKAYALAKQERWGVKMSAATINWGAVGSSFTTTSAYRTVFQDWVGMMDEGILDVNCLMNYKREHVASQKKDYRDWTALAADSKNGRHAIIGQGAYFNYPNNNTTQMEWSCEYPGVDGLLIFRYGCAGTVPGTEECGAPEEVAWQTIRADTFDQRRDIPPAPWLTNPDYGILCGTVRDAAGNPVDGATVTISGGSEGLRKTDGTGFYTFLILPPGTGGRADAQFDTAGAAGQFTIHTGQVTVLDLTLGDDDPMEVAPPTGISVLGNPGENFAGRLPRAYWITNRSGTAIQWTAAHEKDWLSVTPEGGTLNAGQTQAITVAFTAAASALPIHTIPYRDTIVFTNESTGFPRGRDVTLRIGDPSLYGASGMVSY